jgi:competence ComEA-like helix-hairpin-helix protein
MRFSPWWSGSVMAAGFLSLLVPALAGSAGQSPQQLPAGPGRDTFQRVCSGCHMTNLATTQRKSADDWATVVIEMRSRGASGSDDEMESIVNYLATNFGPSAAPAHININTAAAGDIAAALSLTLEQGSAIVAYRDKNGKFKDVTSLEQVPGTDVAKLEAAKDRIDF